MANQSSLHPPQITVSMGRNPIFDVKKYLWGYAIFCVNNIEEDRLGSSPDTQNIALHIASGTYMGVQQLMQQGKKMLIDFNEKNILDGLPYAFPPNLAVISLPEAIFKKPRLMDTIKSLKNAGYQLAIDRFSGNTAFDAFYKQADIFCVDIPDAGWEDMASYVKLADSFKTTLMAKSIENREILEKCHDIGFSLFHGSFFKTPEVFTDRQISSTQISRFNLFRAIEKKEPDIDQLSKTIQADVSISFRLLSYLNSAAFGFSKNIETVHKAITLMGWKQLKKWLRVIILSDMGKDSDATDLIFLSAQRGKFLESIAIDHDFWGFNPDTLFLLGTFSLLDTILSIPMTEIVKHLPVENKIKAALCQEGNNEYLPLLQLARCLEEARWEEGAVMIQNLNLDPFQVKYAFQASVDWANELSAFKT